MYNKEIIAFAKLLQELTEDFSSGGKKEAKKDLFKAFSCKFNITEEDAIEHNIELDDFSHTVAHDLKNPLSQITGFAKLIQDDFDNLKKDTIHEYINKIVVSSNRTDRIINSLLLLSNVRKSEVQKEELNNGYNC